MSDRMFDRVFTLETEVRELRQTVDQILAAVRARNTAESAEPAPISVTPTRVIARGGAMQALVRLPNGATVDIRKADGRWSAVVREPGAKGAITLE